MSHVSSSALRNVARVEREVWRVLTWKAGCNDAVQVLISPLRSSGGFGEMRMSASPTRTAQWGVDAQGVVLSYDR